MGAKPKTIYVCQNCGSESPKWQGKCPDCGEWDTFSEAVAPSSSLSSHNAWLGSAATMSKPEPITKISNAGWNRMQVPIAEFNRVLGGGIVPGSLILIGGDPGIGKSTLLLQISGLLAASGKVLYVSAEESNQQIKLRADRLNIAPDELYLLAETNMDYILQHIEQMQPALVIIDSIQTVYVPDVSSAAGSVSQVRECTSRLMRMGKSRNIPMFLVGHVTKEGALAGPRVLEHIVDTVLYLEGDRYHQYRLLRGVKNRFGSTNEVGVFEMSSDGMIEVPNPSAAFLAERSMGIPGSAVAVTMEGTRPLLVEVQALTSTTSFGMPRRTANGVDNNRLQMLIAVLTKRVGLALSNQDIYVNVVGGMKVDEPAVDLAVATAIASSFRSQMVDPGAVFIGEIGLSGELRQVSQLERRLQEAAKLGFSKGFYPLSPKPPALATDFNGEGVASLAQTIEDALLGEPELAEMPESYGEEDYD